MDELEMIRRKKMLELMKKAGIIEVKPKKPKVIIEVITSPTCPYCPIAWAMAQEIARKYDGVIAKEVSVATPEGQRKAMEHNIMGTPTILINNRVEFIGVPNFAEFERRVRQYLST
ncbi:glutaredoxin [Thermococcus litoralis DSM 5473]|jgi:small redox-active disulfide protein 1|uniref:Glutaredoxin n=1 Tax=Thermococcus litoralis (strain ATCC 51850 / DSM 5473 / JCM 8560 / NS-C) TaxID=523849 RepID=H3ZRJ5_THELN|nr:thioredoxin family protein [Thermococcus litoralis]EHR77401.1 glutaredoxin [Thermococcus litoralis DSM 5473]